MKEEKCHQIEVIEYSLAIYILPSVPAAAIAENSGLSDPERSSRWITE